MFDYTKRLADSTDLGAMLFGLPAWGFERIDNAGMPVPFVRRVLDAIPNIVAIKAEQGYPSIGGIMEMYHHFRDEVIISCPIEGETIPLMSVLDFQFSGTSNTNWMSDYFPRAFELARTGKWEEAMKLLLAGRSRLARRTWRSSTGFRRRAPRSSTAPAGSTRSGSRASTAARCAPPAAANPRPPHEAGAQALVASGLPVTDSPDSEFLRGRVSP